MADNLGRITVGDDQQLLIIITDDNGPVDLTAYTAISASIWECDRAAVADPVISKTLGAGVTLLAQSGTTLGQATIDIDAADWAPWMDITKNTRMEVEVDRVNPAGKKFTFPKMGFDLLWQRNKT